MKSQQQTQQLQSQLLQQSQNQQQNQPTQVQIRQTLALKQLDQPSSQQPLSSSTQPLSPTHTSQQSNAQRQQQLEQQKMLQGKQKELKGVPNIVGLTSIDYQLAEDQPQTPQIEVKDVQQIDIAHNYISQLYEDSVNNSSDLPFKTLAEQLDPNVQYSKIEVVIDLPFQMTLEHIELQISHLNFMLFNKYLKFLKIVNISDTSSADQESSQSNKLSLKSGYFDTTKKVIELNVCGISESRRLKLVFLYNYSRKPAQLKMREFQEKRKEKLFAKTQNVSEKIKNEILPLLNGSDDDIDELDDEVAMISNKKGETNTTPINTDDIRIEIKDNQQKQKSKPLIKTSQVQNQENNNSQSDGTDGLGTRNFNTLPRNYSDPSNKNQFDNDASYVDVSSQQMMDQQMMSNEMLIMGSNIQEQSNQSLLINAKAQGSGDILIQGEFDIFGETDDKVKQAKKLITKCLQGIKVTGFNSNSIPAITNMTYFINQSFYLRQKLRLEEALEYDFMSGVLMISTKRYTQAVEVFRKVQSYYLNLLDQLKIQQTIQSQKAIPKIYLKCALLELLIAESMCQPNQLTERLESLKRMSDLYMQKPVQAMIFTPLLYQTEDPFSAMLKILPYLLKFTVMCLTHKKEIVRMAALKILEFILDTQGCSLDQSMVYILKAMLKTYPQQMNNYQQQQSQPQLQLKHQDSFSLKGFTQSVQDFFQYQQLTTLTPQAPLQGFTTYKLIKEPTSGFVAALKNAYNHALDSYISVLSSISSHILHQLFYEVILTTITANNQQIQSDIKIFAIKIAEKIITICQGDLILSKSSLEYFLTTVGLRTLIEWLVDKMSQIAQNAQQNSLPQQNQQQVVLTESSAGAASNQDISKLEVTEEDTQSLLQLFDIVSMISVGRKSNEAEANSLIKIKQDYCLELYLLINPLLFWLDFSVEREERFPLFKSVYSTIKDVLDNLPAKRVDIDLLQIMIPILQRTTDFLKNNSPSLQMLKFLDIVLRDLKQGGYCQQNSDLQYFFLDMLENFVGYISYCLYEEIFAVFDKLMVMCSDVINEKVITKCIIAMVDKYTIKSKAHKNSMQIFMKGLMEVKVRSHNKNVSQNLMMNTDEDLDDDQISVQSKNNYFEILCDFCFFNNKDPLPHLKPHQVRNDFKSPLDLHDQYIDKLQFFVDSLSLLTEMHVNLFTAMITHPQFKTTLLNLLNKGETSLRLKAHEILEIVSNYYVLQCTSKTVYKMPNQGADASSKSQKQEVMEVEYINQERMYLSQLILQVVRQSLEKKDEQSGGYDSYLQFNSLILLDFMFQNLIPVPTYQNQMQKDRISKSHGKELQLSKDFQVIDLETVEINEHTPEYEVTSLPYTLIRLDLIFNLWPHIQLALNSAWSNIRSICYGLICSMLKIDLKSLEQQQKPFVQQYVQKLKQLVIPMLQSLLSSKESESKAGGLNILGSFCGLSYDFSKVKISKNMEFFKKNSSYISLQIWQLVFELQDDWDITIKEASVVLIQLCAPRDAVRYFEKVKKESEDKRFNDMLMRYGLGPANNGVGKEGAQSSSMSSARDHQQMMIRQYSMASNDEENPIIIKKNTQSNNVLSFLSGTDEMSMLLQMEQQQPFQTKEIAGTDIFDHIGNTINSNAGVPLQLKDLQNQQNDDQKILQEGIDFYNTQNMEGLQSETLFDFFVDQYSDDQIQEIISIFRNDFKPPKNLWIEKNQTQFNSPDYYAEIYSSAIDQFNQQQAQLQQQQQQQQQQMFSSSPKNSKSANTGVQSIVDALEDDLVKKYENEKKEKEKQQQLQKQAVQDGSKNGQDNYMIFERHFEDEKEEEEKDDAKQQNNKPATTILDQNSNIDAEPFQFLDKSPIKQEIEIPAQKKGNKKNKKQNKDDKKKHPQPQPAQQLQINIIDDNDQIKQSTQAVPQQPTPQSINLSQNLIPPIDEFQQNIQPAQPTQKQNKKSHKDKKTTDELIEEYERKISKTKQLLEEEKKKTKVQQQQYQDDLINPLNIKSTPEFKSKKGNHNGIQNNDDHFAPLQKSNEKKKNHSNGNNNANIELLPKNFMSNIDNAKLLKQINNCFNDNSFNNFNIGPVVMTTNINSSSGSTKHKQKLNKSFENILAANKHSQKQNSSHIQQQPLANVAANKKNLSTSPRRGSSSGKKSGSAKSGVGSKKKYLVDYQQKTKPLYNMRDLNYFIKTIEKDLSDKFNKLNLKDFNSMPTTPTSILKKVEDQMKAMNYNTQQQKTQMSNTCPNMAQVLSNIAAQDANTIRPQNSSNQVLQVSQLNNLTNNPLKNIQQMAKDYYPQQSSTSTYNSHLTTPSNNNIMLAAQSQNSLSNYSLASHQLDHNKYLAQSSFSKTQKLDLKETNKQLAVHYQIPGREGQTARGDYHNENNISNLHANGNIKKAQRPSPSNNGANSKTRTRVSQEKYNSGALINSNSGSSSFTKLNKSLNNIQSNNNTSQSNKSKKESLSKSMISTNLNHNIQGSKLAQNMSPNSGSSGKSHSKKQIMEKMIKQQFNQSQATTQIQQTPLNTHQQQMTNQYSFSSNLLYDYIQNSEQTSKKNNNGNNGGYTNLLNLQKTPNKASQQIPHKITGKGGNYSEILEISPASAEKELRYYNKNQL